MILLLQSFQAKKINRLDFGLSWQEVVLPRPNVKTQLLEAFKSFFQHNGHFPYFEDGVEGVYEEDRIFHNFLVGKDLEVFVLDMRQYRDTQGHSEYFAPIVPRGSSKKEICEEYKDLCPYFPEKTDKSFFDPRNKTALGRVQKKWLLKGLKHSSATYKVIVSSYNWNYAYLWTADYMQAYRRERDRVFRFIEKNNIENVVFAVGDWHASWFCRLNPGRSPVIWEVATGPIGQDVYPAPGIFDEFRFINDFWGNGQLYDSYKPMKYYYNDEPNYMTIEVKNGKMVIKTKTANGSIAIDRYGRAGVLTLPREDEPISPPLKI